MIANSPRYQVLRLATHTANGPAWEFVAHGARMSEKKAQDFVEMIQRNGRRAMSILVPAA